MRRRAEAEAKAKARAAERAVLIEAARRAGSSRAIEDDQTRAPFMHLPLGLSSVEPKKLQLEEMLKPMRKCVAVV